MTTEQTLQRSPATAFVRMLRDVKPLQMSDPLAETLGAFQETHAVMEYAYTDVIKLTGHACPTTAAAFECCRAALKRLFPERIPVRGAIEVSIYGEPDDGVYGVVGQVLGLITGAASNVGFKGLATFFRRKDLLRYDPAKGAGLPGMNIRFKRTDTGAAVLGRIEMDRVPSPGSGVPERIGGLLRKVLWDAATGEEEEAFRNLWRRNVAVIFESAKNNPDWLTIKETD